MAQKTPIPLEDGWLDILGKAIRGCRMQDAELSERSTVPVSEIQQLKNGRFEDEIIRKIAPILGLSARALSDCAEQNFFPRGVNIAGLAQFNTPFEDMRVNSYLVWDPLSGDAVAFDTGSDCDPMLAFIRDKGLRLGLIALTHSHGDHIFDLDRLREKTGAPAYIGSREPVDGAMPLEEGASFQVGKLKVEALLTSGHSPGGMTYLVKGLERLVAVVGDSIFAGSMGGGGISYSDALRNNREKILTLPEDTVLCPGHGPFTSVGEELIHNPFFAK